MRAEWQPFPGAQGLQLREREVFGKPAGDVPSIDTVGRLPVGEAVGNIGRRADFVFVPGDQDAILGDDQIRLDHVRALLDRQAVRLERVLRTVAAGAAVADDQRAVRSIRNVPQRERHEASDRDHPDHRDV